MISGWLRAAALLTVLCGSIGGCSRAPNRQTAALSADAVALNNRGVGLMGQFEYRQARDIFRRLTIDHPERSDLQVNLGIATMHGERDGDLREAQRIFDRVLAGDPVNVRAHYNLGLLYLHDGRAAEALPHFVTVAERDPGDGYAAYYVAQCRSLTGEFTGALASYQKALAVNPHLRSAAYGAFQAMQRLGRSDAPQMLERFRALEANPQSEVAEFKYTRLGPLAETATIDQPQPARAARPPGSVFQAVPIRMSTAPVTWHRFAAHDSPSSITAADIDGDGAIDVFIAGAIDDRGVRRNALLLNRGRDGFVLDVDHPLSGVADVEAALWGDYDNDGLIDVYFCRRGENQLWRQTEKGRWSNVTVAARAGGGGGTTIDGAMFDADHDGDLDLLLIKSQGTNELLNNNGDGTFQPIGAAIGLAADRAPSIGAVIADLDADRDADIVVIKRSTPHTTLLNDRMWHYRTDRALDPIARAPIAAAVAGDLDADGRPELYTSGPDGIRRWTRAASGTWEPRLISGTERLAGSNQLALADVNGDGRLELLGTDRDRRWQALAISAEGDATSVFSEQGPPVSSWTLAMLDAASGPSLVAMPDDGGAPLLWRPGPGRFPFVELAFTGRDPRSRQIRSNTSGVGTKVAARTGSRWTAIDTYRPQSGAGQSLQPLPIGLGGAAQIDFVAITWSDGVYQSELELAAGVRTIGETQRQLSSCPVLFAFDGRNFAFVTDLLGVGGIGTPTRPGVYASPRPREDVLLPEGLLAATDGRYALKIAEPMEEVAYLDAARLRAYDLPPGWQVTLDERQDTSQPVATGEPRFYRDERTPIQATLDDGVARQDVTSAVTTADGAASSPGRIDPRHIGRTDEQVLTLRFDRALDQTNPMLVADGWIEYPYAQTLFAAWQSRAPYRAPTIEARGRDGRWQVVRHEFGYPAGMPRRISVPLGPLPAGTTELRLRSTLEVYWDRLAVADAANCPLAIIRELPLTTARLTRTGFPHRALHPNRRPSYDYDQRSPFDDVRYARGLYTAEGPVTELLARDDGALAIFGPGEELHLEFAAAQPPLPTGWTRRFVLQARGWCKDMDLFTKDGDTVEPLPGTRTGAAAQLQRAYTTRYESGR